MLLLNPKPIIGDIDAHGLWEILRSFSPQTQWPVACRTTA